MNTMLFFLYLVVNLIAVRANVPTRLKREGKNFFSDLLSQLTAAVQKVTEVLSNKPSNDVVKGPEIITAQDLGFCTTNPNNCQYISCLADNFKQNYAKNLKAATVVLLDPDLRKAVATDPFISKAACEQANLTKSACEKFKLFLGVVNVFDPDSLHIDDEPRDKRSPFDDYEDFRTTKAKYNLSVTTTKPQIRTKDCEEIKREFILERTNATGFNLTDSSFNISNSHTNYSLFF